MATKISEIIDQVRLILQDVDKVRWQDTELFLWIGSAYREIIAVNPSVGAKVISFPLVAGTFQTLPADGISLIDITRNLTGAKMPVHEIERKVLDNQYPTWHGDPSTGQIKCYVYDPAAPNQFWVWPQATATPAMTVELAYAAVPQKPTALADNVAINDAYTGVIVDFVLYRAYSKDSVSGDANLAQSYRQAFYDSLNVNSTHKGAAQLHTQNTNGIQ